jgi:hypothetical protein
LFFSNQWFLSAVTAPQILSQVVLSLTGPARSDLGQKLWLRRIFALKFQLKYLFLDNIHRKISAKQPPDKP